MKKIFLITAALGLGLCLTGCVKTDTTVTFNRAGHAKVENTIMLDKKVLADMGKKDPWADTKNQRGYKDVKLKDVEDEKYKGIKATLKVRNAAKKDIAHVLPEYYTPAHKSENAVVARNFLLFTLYDVKINAADKDAKKSGYRVNSMIDCTFKLKLPRKALCHNAEIKKGSLYEWKVDLDDGTPIEAKFVVFNLFNVLILLALAALGFTKMPATLRENIAAKVKPLLEKLAPYFEKIKPYLAKLEPIVEKVKPVIQKAKPVAQKLVDTAKSLAQKAKPVVEKAADKIKTAAKNAKKGS